MSVTNAPDYGVTLSDGKTIDDLVSTDPASPHIARRIYGDEELHELEFERIFRRAWGFLGHESEIPEPGDYVARNLAGEPVVLIRGQDGEVRAFLNSCRHRGMRVCRADRDNVRFLRCIYHGWTYNTEGGLVQAFAEELYEPGNLKKDELGLIAVAQIESFHGMVFATWSDDVPPLEEFLGDMGWYLKTLVGRTKEGLEVVGTPQVWEVSTNWKFGVDNFIGDPFHLPTAHGSIYQLGLLPADPMAGNDGHAINAGHGHQLLLSNPDSDEHRFYGMPDEVRREMEEDEDEVRRELMRNSWYNVGSAFPNISWLQIQPTGDPETPPTPYTNFRLWEPIGLTKTRVWSWFVVDKVAPEDFKQRSYECYVRTFGPSGIYEQDDMENWEECTRVNQGAIAQRHNLHHGMGLHVKPSDEFIGRGTGYVGTFNEVTQLAYYDEWRRWLSLERPWEEWA